MNYKHVSVVLIFTVIIYSIFSVFHIMYLKMK